MRTENVIAFYKGTTRAAKALGIHRSSIYQWGEFVPQERQFEIEVKTGGLLKSDWTLAKEGMKHNE